MVHSQTTWHRRSMSAQWAWFQNYTNPNKFRLIVDLSHPVGNSVISSLSSIQYASVDMAVDMIKQLGRGTQLLKLNIKDAYRIIPIHPADYHLLGISWKGKTYVDRALPFGGP